MIFTQEDIEKLKKVKDVIMKDICLITDKGNILPTEYQNFDHAVNAIHHIAEIEEAIGKEAGYDYDMSGRRYDIQMESSGRYYPYVGSSYERGRSARTGRYVSMDNDPYTHLNNMMAETSDPNERAAIQRVMDRMR